MRTGNARVVGPVVLVGALVLAACGGASGGADLGSANGSGMDATVDVAGGDSVVSSPEDDASAVDAGTTPVRDAGGRTPTDADVTDGSHATDGAGPDGGGGSPVDSGGGGGGDDGGGVDAGSDGPKDRGPFPCGPSLMCDAKTQYCSHATSSTIIVVDSGSTYSCEPLPACDAADICSCFVTSPVDTCTCTDDGSGITRTCSCRVCATP